MSAVEDGDRLGRRCAAGCETWPDSETFNVCPICNEETTRFRSVTPITEEEATSFMLNLQFEQFYKRHCQRLGSPVEGPLPSQPG